MCDFDGDNLPEFSDVTRPTARKPHRCCECHYTIPPGERYERTAGKWDGEFKSFSTCERCADLRDSVAAASGGCFQFGGLFFGHEYAEALQQILPNDAAIQAQIDRVFDAHRTGCNLLSA